MYGKESNHFYEFYRPINEFLQFGLKLNGCNGDEVTFHVDDMDTTDNRLL